MKLALQFTISFIISVAFFGLALFWPAGTFDYWQAWVYMAVFVLHTAMFAEPMLVLSFVWLGLHEPSLDEMTASSPRRTTCTNSPSRTPSRPNSGPSWSSSGRCTSWC